MEEINVKNEEIEIRDLKLKPADFKLLKYIVEYIGSDTEFTLEDLRAMHDSISSESVQIIKLPELDDLNRFVKKGFLQNPRDATNEFKLTENAEQILLEQEELIKNANHNKKIDLIIKSRRRSIRQHSI